MPDEEEKDELDDLYEAMKAANKAFEEYFTKRGLDAAYWKLELSGFTLDNDFKKWKTIDMKEVEDDG